jgi:hypothetical protein
MKRLFLTLALIFSVIEARGNEIELSAGMPISSAVKILRDVATDLTSGLAISSAPEGQPRRELCWELRDYDLVVWLYAAEDARISSLGYWTKSDFNQPKMQRYDVERTARQIVLNTEKHTYHIEKFPRYFPLGSVEKYEESSYGPILAAMGEPVLSALGKGRDYFAYRLLYLPGDRAGPCPDVAAVRYEKQGDRCVRRSVILSAVAPGKKAAPKEILVPTREVKALMGSLEGAGFWKLPKDDNVDVVSKWPGQPAKNRDRSRLVVEVIRDGKHRVRVRWSPACEADKRGLSGLVSLCERQLRDAGFWTNSR